MELLLLNCLHNNCISKFCICQARHSLWRWAARLKLTTAGRGGEGTTFSSCWKHDEIMIHPAFPRVVPGHHLATVIFSSERCFTFLYLAVGNYTHNDLNSVLRQLKRIR